jgi:hypothetical protein
VVEPSPDLALGLVAMGSRADSTGVPAAISAPLSRFGWTSSNVRCADVAELPSPERSYGKNFVDLAALTCDDARLASAAQRRTTTTR